MQSNRKYKMYLEKVGGNIKAARRKAGITQEQLAKIMGYDRSGLSYIETGRNACTIATLKCIADALGCDIKDFL